MALRKTLQRWWDALLGRPPWYRDTGTTTTKSGLRPAQSGATAAPGEISIADDSATTGSKAQRSVGVNPYSNDAGYAKPHSWERVDHD